MIRMACKRQQAFCGLVVQALAVLSSDAGSSKAPSGERTAGAALTNSTWGSARCSPGLSLGSCSCCVP